MVFEDHQEQLMHLDDAEEDVDQENPQDVVKKVKVPIILHLKFHLLFLNVCCI